MSSKWRWGGHFGWGGQGRPREIKEVAVFEVGPKASWGKIQGLGFQVMKQQLQKPHGSKNHFMSPEQKGVSGQRSGEETRGV